MKKFIIFLLVIILLSGCTTGRKNSIGKTINLDMKSCKIVEQKDTHGGFLGDGEYYAKIKCDKFSLTDEWNSLPLSSDILKIMNLISCDNKSCKTAFERYNIPNGKNGYYYFLDRYNMSHDDSELNTRNFYNFSLAIYDQDTGYLYYYELDT